VIDMSVGDEHGVDLAGGAGARAQQRIEQHAAAAEVGDGGRVAEPGNGRATRGQCRRRWTDRPDRWLGSLVRGRMSGFCSSRGHGAAIARGLPC
jgi:hypothetical protein